jgi:hypothetical protein
MIAAIWKKKKKLARNIVLYLMHNYKNIACDSVISVPLSLSLCQEPIFMEKRGLKRVVNEGNSSSISKMHFV